jgi:hypothetical protein
MAWNSPLSASEQQAMDPDPCEYYEVWFAWYPVKVDNGTIPGKWVWLKTIHREMVNYSPLQQAYEYHEI